MSNCLLSTGYSVGCLDNLGGVQKFYIATYSASTTYSADSTGLIVSGTNQPTYYSIEQLPETGEFNQEGQHNKDTGTNHYVQLANMTLFKYQASLKNLIQVLAQTRTRIIVLSQTGKYFVLGEQNGTRLINSAPSVGKGFGDLNGSTLNFEAKEPALASEMSSAYFATLTVV